MIGAQLLLIQRGGRNQGLRIGVHDDEIFAQLVHFGADRLDLLVFGLIAILQNLDAADGLGGAAFHPVIVIRLGNGISQGGRFIFVRTVNRDAH